MAQVLEGGSAVIFSVGMFEAPMSTGTFHLLSMADLGLPVVFARHAVRTMAMWVAIVNLTDITIVFSFRGFDDVVATANFTYILGTLLEFAPFISFHTKYPELNRPYRVPLPLPALMAMCVVSSVFLVYMFAVAGWRVFALSARMTALGVGWHTIMRLSRSKKLFKFNDMVAADYREADAGDTV